MRNRRLNAVSAVRANSRPIFQVVVAYEDYAAGRRANETCSFLLSQLGDEFELRCGMWKFEILRNAKLAEIAAAEALEADVFIVAAHGSSPLPIEVTSWIDHWLPLRDERTTALIALIDGNPNLMGGTPPAYSYLEEIAAKAKMDFLPQLIASGGVGFPPPGTGLPPGARSAGLEELMRPSPVPERPARHWGINE